MNNEQGSPLRLPRHTDSLRRSVPPAVVVTLNLEGRPSVTIQAATLADEHRLRLWLHRSGALRDLSALVQAALEELDRRSERAA